jgi:hypothetical protein
VAIMSHWAEIDKNNTVVRVVVCDNNDLNGDEGYKWLIDNLGGTWIKTSYNTVNGVHRLGGTPLRHKFAGIGYIYDPDFDVFIAPRPYPSWKLDYTTYQWEAPVAKPEDTEEYFYKWSEINKEWIQVAIPA